MARRQAVFNKKNSSIQDADEDRLSRATDIYGSDLHESIFQKAGRDVLQLREENLLYKDT
jgi:hypothetical protein